MSCKLLLVALATVAKSKNIFLRTTIHHLPAINFCSIFELFREKGGMSETWEGWSVGYVISMIERMFIVATSALLPPTPCDSRRNNNRNSFSSSFSLSTFLLIISLEHFFFCVLGSLFCLFYLFAAVTRRGKLRSSSNKTVHSFYVVRLAFAIGFPHSDELPSDEEMLPEQECLQASWGEVGFDNPDS
jgi:hypothetical protein